MPPSSRKLPGLLPLALTLLAGALSSLAAAQSGPAVARSASAAAQSASAAVQSASATVQSDPGLKNVVARTIAQAQCFPDRFDSAVWYRLMEPRLRRKVPDQNERVVILQEVYCETHRPGEARLPPGLVMALIDVESGFDRWAVSSAGAVGLMQVMPFWPERLGMRRYELTHVDPNVRMGCAILRYYLKQAHHDYAKALAHYNGSVGRRNYSDEVLERWGERWQGADDLGNEQAAQPVQAAQAVRKPAGS